MILDCNLNIDPWLLSTFMVQISSVDINNENDRQRLTDAAEELLEKINKKVQRKQH